MLKGLLKSCWLAAALATVMLGTGAAHAQSLAMPRAASLIADDYDAMAASADTPSTLDARLRFAEQAIEQGNLEAAIGALERLLAANPDLPRVRLELGVLYFKLGSFETARRYFEEAIKRSDVPADVKARVAIYLAEIDRRLSPYEYALFLQAGVRYQTNATIGPDSTLVHALGQNALITPQFAQVPDWNWYESAALNFAWKLDHRGDAIELALLEYYAGQSRVTQFNLGLVEAVLGPRLYLNQTLSIKPYVIGDGVWLGDAPYFAAVGGGGSVRAPIGDHLQIDAWLEQRYRHFYDSADFPLSSELTGDLTTAALSFDAHDGFWHFTTRLSLDQEAAEFNYTSYDRWSVDIGAPMQFTVPLFDVGHQLVFTPTAGFSYTPYRAPDPNVDPSVSRLDREYRLGALVDFQLWGSYGIRTQVSQTWIRSTLPNFTSNNFTVAIGPTARF